MHKPIHLLISQNIYLNISAKITKYFNIRAETNDATCKKLYQFEQIYLSAFRCIIKSAQKWEFSLDKVIMSSIQAVEKET